MGSGAERIFPDEKVRCDRPSYAPGGGGINVARVVHRLGGDVLAVHTMGGPTGDTLTSLLDDEGVPHTAVPIAGTVKQSFMVAETSTGRQYRFTFPGPELAPDEWRASLDAVSDARPEPAYVVASGSFPPGVPPEAAVDLARRVEGWGGRLIVDTVGEPLERAAAHGVFLIKPNYREIAGLTGADPDDPHVDREAAARDLVGPNEAILLSLGRAGAYLVRRDAPPEHLRAPTVTTRSRVGAGDSMVAGVVHGLARDWSMRDAARYGLACGAAAVMTPGTELCRPEDVERLWERMGREDTEES